MGRVEDFSGESLIDMAYIVGGATRRENDHVEEEKVRNSRGPVKHAGRRINAPLLGIAFLSQHAICKRDGWNYFSLSS